MRFIAKNYFRDTQEQYIILYNINALGEMLGVKSES